MKIAIVTLPDNYPYPYSTSFTWVLILVCLLSIQYAFTMYAFTMRARLNAFTAEFMKKFAEEHAAAFPNRPTVPEFGYPDCGNGRYGKQLSYT